MNVLKMGFTKEFFETIVKEFGNISSTENKDYDLFFYLYFEGGSESYEEDSFAIDPLDGVLEVVDLNVEGKDRIQEYIPYEKINNFSVTKSFGSDSK